MGHHHYHLFYLHRNSDIRWNLGWDHCYLVDLSIERGYFLFFRFMDMYLGDLGGELSVYLLSSIIQFISSGYLGIPSFHINCVPVRRMVFGEGLSGLRAGCQ